MHHSDHHPHRSVRITTAVLAIGLGALVTLACRQDQDGTKNPEPDAAVAHDPAFVQYDSGGQLLRPKGYREWVYIGTPLTPNDLNDGEAGFPEFHNVYIDPTSYAHYRDTGEFREGTVIIKELVSVEEKSATSGNGYFQGGFVGLEALIKSAEKYPDEPGNWAFYSFGHAYPLADAATPFPAKDCSNCHDESAAQDFVFTQYYPILEATRDPDGVIGKPDATPPHAVRTKPAAGN